MQGVTRTYTQVDIPYWEERLSEAQATFKAACEEWGKSDGGAGSAGPRGNNIRWAELALKLLRSNVSIIEVSDGILINERVVVAVQTRKWRIKGKGKWLKYRNLQEVVAAANELACASKAR